MKKFAILLCLIAAPLGAEPVIVRSGEHDDFTRLVFDFKSQVQWHLVEQPGFLKIQFGATPIDFDLSGVFRLIPRDRIKDIQVSSDQSGIVIQLGGEAHARTFEVGNGAVVVDILSGPDPDKTMPIAAPLDREGIIPVLPEIKVSSFEDKLSVYWNLDSQGTPGGRLQTSLSTPSSNSNYNIKVAEEALRQQIGRAASQGLIEVDITKSIPSSGSLPMMLNQNETGNTANGRDNVAMQSQTAIDRDNPSTGKSSSVSHTGVSCISDEDLDLAEWLGEGNPIDRLLEARQFLIEELDHPSTETVLNLSKIYVAMGFGAEAIAAISEMKVETANARILVNIAKIIDEMENHESSVFLTMADCDTSAALWSILASSPEDHIYEVNERAVIRAFSSLPTNLRNHLGSRLVDQLLVLNKPGTAQSIRDVIARTTAYDSDDLSVINAKIFPDHRSPELKQALKMAAARTGVNSNAALLLLIESRLKDGNSIENNLIESTGTLAHEHQETPEGSAFLRAHILSLGSAGRFEEAFTSINQWPREVEPNLRKNTIHFALKQLSEFPDDKIFLTNFLEQQGNIDSTTPLETRHSLASRLLNHGFARIAQTVLETPESVAREDKILLARASLQLGDGAASLSHISGLDGKEVDAIRDEALRLLGDYLNTNLAFHGAEDYILEAEESWKTNSIDVTKNLDTPLQNQSWNPTNKLQLEPLDTNNSSILLNIESSTSYIDQSKDTRRLLSHLLDKTQEEITP